MTVKERKQAIVSSCCHVDLEKDDFFFEIKNYTPLIATVRFPALFEASSVFRAQSERYCYGKIGSIHFKGPP